MAKVKVKDNRGQARKKSKIAAFGKMRRVQKVGAHKLVPVAPALATAHASSAQRQAPVARVRPPHNLYAGDSSIHVLLLGEGDLGFAASLATLWGECPRLVATTLQREALVLARAGAEDNIEMVRACGGTVLFGVDATRGGEKFGRKKGFDRVVFNFPLASGGTSKDAPAVTATNQSLLRELFSNAATGTLLAQEGELHVTVPRGQPYESWGLTTLAKLAGLRVKCATPFHIAAFPGYTSDAPHTGAGALTYAFIKAAVRPSAEPETKKFDGCAKEMAKQRRKKARRP